MLGHPVAPTPGTPELVKQTPLPGVTNQVTPSSCHVCGGDFNASSAASSVDFATSTPFTLIDTADEYSASFATFDVDIQPQPMSGPRDETLCDTSCDSSTEHPVRFAS